MCTWVHLATHTKEKIKHAPLLLVARIRVCVAIWNAETSGDIPKKKKKALRGLKISYCYQKKKTIKEKEKRSGVGKWREGCRVLEGRSKDMSARAMGLGTWQKQGGEGGSE